MHRKSQQRPLLTATGTDPNLSVCACISEMDPFHFILTRV